MMLKVPVTAADHIRGDNRAPVMLVEYGDCQCPHCGKAYREVERVRQHFGRSLGFVFRHFPLTQIHPLAESAAETAEFAAHHGEFWAMHDALYLNQSRLGMPLLFALAGAFELPQGLLRDALASGTYAGKVQFDFLGGVRSGVNGTPTFFINGTRHDAAFDFDTLSLAIGSVIARARPATMISPAGTMGGQSVAEPRKDGMALLSEDAVARAQQRSG
ncbi:MAG TPA: DsbA family protein [Rhizomicrobium sp.]|jgi:protein-disulfide isomerase